MDAWREVGGGQRDSVNRQSSISKGSAVYMAYFRVHSRAVSSYFALQCNTCQ